MKKRLFGAILAVALVVSCFTLFAFDANAATNMKASYACINMIKDTEGFFAIPYWDYSQWTVGFGSTCPADRLEEYQQTGIPVEEAEALFQSQLATFEQTVNSFARKYGLKLTQNQFDALVSFTYNLGGGVLTKNGSTIASAVLSGANGNEMIYAFSIYCMAGGEFLPGLMRRRMAEANMFINGIYSDYAPDSYCYVRYNANGGVRDISAQGYDANMPAEPMSRPTRNGYVFVGWFTQPDGGVKVTRLDEFTNGWTLYAHWQKSEMEAENPVDPTEGINVIVVSAAVNVRCGPSIGYGTVSSVHAGDRLTILGTTMSNGTLWGQFEEGWIDLVHTNYREIVAPDTDEEEQKPTWKLPVMATVLNPNGILVYNGPHTTYPQLRTLKVNTQILVEEIMTFAGKDWARYEGGWVQMGKHLLIHDENKLAHNFTAVTNQILTVRSGPGTSYNKETTLAKGTSHTVYSVAMVNGEAWGRVPAGWISLTYTNFDVSKLDQYRNHKYGAWYVSVAGTCLTPGQERRDCAYCDHYESRDGKLGDHVYGSWYVVKEADCTNNGLEQRDCKHCDHYETREITDPRHAWDSWVQLLEATCTETGKEQRTCHNCGIQETREIPARGHSFGAWYETKSPTDDAAGEQRRDCQHCDYFETRPVDKVTTVRTYATVTCSTLRVRSGPGTGYAAVGKLVYGDKVEIFEIKTVDGSDWGRMETGWICLTGLTELSYVEENHTDHTYGDWYTQKEATCTEDGVLRRDCACGHYETKPIPATGHRFGEWYTVREATTEKSGLQRRDCACGHYETREIPKLNVTVRTYATITCDALSIRAGAGTGYARLGYYYKGEKVEILEQVKVGTDSWGRTARGWICLTGYTTLEEVREGVEHTHSYGDWYVTKAATTKEPGQERRDCACGHYETREIPKLEPVTRVYATITCDALSIRAGAGTGYARLGYYYKGQTVEILEQKKVGTDTWGRTAKGWICLTGYTTLKTITE